MAAASTALMALVVAGYAYLRHSGAFPGEARLADALRLPPTGGHVDLAANLMSYLGDPLIATVIVIVLVAGAWEEGGRRPAALMAGAAGVVLLTKLLKTVFGPTQAGALTISAENYPSGTTAFVTSVFGMAGWLLWRGGHRVAAGACALLVAGVGPGVVAVGEHYPSDALAGYASGGAWLLAMLAVAARLERAA